MTAPADDAAPIWHTIPTKRRVTPADLPDDGARVVVRGDHLSERDGYWDAGAREWWGTRVNGQAVDWRASMAVAEAWREYERQTEDQAGA